MDLSELLVQILDRDVARRLDGMQQQGTHDARVEGVSCRPFAGAGEHIRKTEDATVREDRVPPLVVSLATSW